MPLRSVPAATLVFEVRSPIVHPVAAKAGDYLLVEVGAGRSTVSIVRRQTVDPKLCGAIAGLVSTGAVVPLEGGGAVKLAELASAGDYTERPRAGRFATGRPQPAARATECATRAPLATSSRR